MRSDLGVGGWLRASQLRHLHMQAGISLLHAEWGLVQKRQRELLQQRFL
jgi:hypothetical protein